MRILVSIENKECLQSLQSNLCSFIQSVDEDEVFIDVIHVYNPVKVTSSMNLEEKLEEIKKDERKTKVRFIGECENKLEAAINSISGKSALVNSFLLEGDYKDKIKQHIIFHNYSLLVLVPREKLNFNEILKGRNTHWVIDNLEVPVLLLPSNINMNMDIPIKVTCFVDDKVNFDSLMRSEMIQKVKKDHIQFLHFGRHEITEGVQTVNSDNISQSLKGLTEDKSSNSIFVLVHKNKGDFLNFLNKSFTKTVIGSLENPLLIF